MSSSCGTFCPPKRFGKAKQSHRRINRRRLCGAAPLRRGAAYPRLRWVCCLDSGGAHGAADADAGVGCDVPQAGVAAAVRIVDGCMHMS
jgi:hypothetical protein